MTAACHATDTPLKGSSKNLTGLIGVGMMRVIGPRFMSSYYKRVYDGL